MRLKKADPVVVNMLPAGPLFTAEVWELVRAELSRLDSSEVIPKCCHVKFTESKNLLCLLGICFSISLNYPFSLA